MKHSKLAVIVLGLISISPMAFGYMDEGEGGRCSSEPLYDSSNHYAGCRIVINGVESIKSKSVIGEAWICAKACEIAGKSRSSDSYE